MCVCVFERECESERERSFKSYSQKLGQKGRRILDKTFFRVWNIFQKLIEILEKKIMQNFFVFLLPKLLFSLSLVCVI